MDVSGPVNLERGEAYGYSVYRVHFAPTHWAWTAYGPLGREDGQADSEQTARSVASNAMRRLREGFSMPDPSVTQIAVQSARRLVQKLARWAESDGQPDEAGGYLNTDAQLAEYDVAEETDEDQR